MTVKIQGVADKKILENIHSMLSIEKYGNEPDLTTFAVHKLHDKAPSEIREALEPFGYYKSDIHSNLTREEGGWQAVYRIRLGKPVHVSSVRLEITGPGAGEKSFRQLKDNFSLKAGDVLNQKVYEDAKGSISDAALEFGYLRGKFDSHSIEVSLASLTAKIVLHFDTGPRFLFGQVIIDQNILDPKFIRGYVPFKKGDPYRTSALLELQSALSQSQYFSLVEVRPLMDQIHDLYVPVAVKARPKNRYLYSFGAGYGTDTGLRGLIGWEYRRINSKGHHFNTELRLSQIKQDVSARYTIPVGDPRSDHVDLVSGFTAEDTKTSMSKKLVVGPTYTHKRDDLIETEYLKFQHEQFKIDGESGDSRLFLPGVTWLKVRSDNPIYPTHGYKLNLDVKGTTSWIGSNATFVQARLDAAMVQRFLDDGRFIFRTHLGLTETDTFSNIPATLRFFAGGDNSIRGYSYNSLGPKNSAGKVVGGKYLLIGSIEYDHIIYDKWSLAVFYDAGNALQTVSDPIKKGAGLGIRWRSPVGPVKVDFSRGLSTPEGWMLSFSVGPEL